MPKLPADYFDTALEGLLFIPMLLYILLTAVLSVPFYILGKLVHKIFDSLEKRRRE